MAVGGPTDTRVVYVDTVVYTTGPSHTVITRRDKRGSTLYIYRTVYRHYTPATTAQQEHVSLVQHQGAGGGTNVGSHASTTPAWVYQRQRLLKAQGFNVRVDGHWGAASQTAWAAYRRLKTVQQTIRDEREETLDLHRIAARRLTQRRVPGEDKIASLLSQTLLGDQAAREEAQRQLDRIAARRGRRAEEERLATQQYYIGTRLAQGDAKTDRRIIGGLSVRTMAEFLFDPEFGAFDGPEDTQAVRYLQTHLKANGHPGLKVDGIYGRATFDALVEEMERQQKIEHDAAVDAVRHRWYKSGLIEAGAALPSWWMLPGFDRVPKPGELLTVLQKGGFSAAILLRELDYRAEQRQDWVFDPRYVNWRNNYLRRGAMASGQFLDFPGLRPSEAQLRMIPGSEPFFEARTFEGLQSEIQKYEREQERAYMEELRQRVEDEKGFWGSVAEGLSWMSDQVRAGAVEIYWAFDDLIHLRYEDWWLSEEETKERQREALEAVHRFDQRHFWWGLATAIIADPLNLIPGKVFLTPVTATARGAVVLERVGVGLANGGRIARISGVSLAAPARTGRYAWATADRTWEGVIRMLEDTAVHFPASPLGRSYLAMKHAVQLKGTVQTAIRVQVRDAVSRGFRPLGSTAVRKTAMRDAGHEVDDWEFTFSPDVQDGLDSTEGAILPRITDPDPDVLDSMIAGKASIYAGADTGEFSAIGWQLSAYYKEKARVWAGLKVAWDDAEAYARRKVDPDGLMLAVDRYSTEYKAAFAEGFEAARNRLGSYWEGSADPAFAAMVRGYARSLGEMIDKVYLPALQRRIELALGEELWDDAGLWVGRQGDLQALLRDLLKRGIDNSTVTMKNPLAGRVFSRGEMEELVEMEIARRAGSKIGYGKVREAAGEAAPKGYSSWDEWAERQVHSIENDVSDAWQYDRKAGGWRDVRETIEVPALYAGHLGAAASDDITAQFLLDYQGAVERHGVEPGTLSQIAEPAGATARRVREANADFPGDLRHADEMTEPTFDAGLKVIAWLDSVIPKVDEPVGGWGAADLTADETLAKQMIEFKAVADSRLKAIRRAEEEAYVHAVRRNGMFFEALRQSQNRPIRYLANTFTSFTSFWKFSTLALRPAWLARNTADNTVKVLLQGVIDPRFWMSGAARPGQALRTVFEGDLRAIREFLRWADVVFGDGSGRVVEAFDAVLDQVWSVSENILSRVFWMHGIPVSEQALREAKMARDIFGEGRDRIIAGQRHSGAIGPAKTQFRSGTDTTFTWAARSFYENAWELMGTRPENYFKRVLYRSTYAKAIKRGADDYTATKEAWAAVEKVLFDYSKITVAEEGLKAFFPFIQFWRKNSVFWLRTAAEKPWFVAGLLLFESKLQEAHADWPEWMKRYLHINEVADAIARVPGLGWLGPHLTDLNVMYDPLNFFSFAPLYRAFKSTNPELPADRAGWKFISGFVDGMAEFGLGINPLVRKPLEVAGVLNYRAWQSIFPQTSLVEAFTRKFWSDRFPNGLDIEAMLEDPILEMMGQETSTEASARNFNTYVQMEMTNQRVRGETVSRERAEEKIRDYFLIQNLIGYFVGTYVRRMTPEDFYLYQITEDLYTGEKDFLDLSPEDQENYRLWKLRKTDAVHYDRYLEAIPLIRSFYNEPSYAERQAFLARNPNIIPYVTSVPTTELPSLRYVQQAAMAADTDAAMDFYALVDTLKLDAETTRLAESVWVTPELREYWNANDTPADQRAKMMRAGYFRHLGNLNDSYHAIPDDDFDAKQGFLEAHPELERWWNDNNSAYDDYKMIVNSVNADLREQYFEYVDAGDWPSADAYLKRFPFMFEFTSAAGRVSEDGEWMIDRDGNRIRRAFTRSQHAADYLRAKPYLDFYFSLAPERRSAWLNGDSEGARIVRAYFAKYSSTGGFSGQAGMTEHARDYIKAKPYLETYFSMSKADRAVWLAGGSHGASVVREYFRKYGKTHQIERAFNAIPDSAFGTTNPEIAIRLRFWRKYFSLTPDKRPKFVQNNAERYGIFVYGILGAQERAQQEAEWLRQAFLAGLTPRAAAYLYVKPLLDFFFKLGKEEKQLFLRANPEVAAYLDRFANNSPTGDPRLDKLLDRYFNLPPDSNERSAFLRKHPEIQDYFDSRSTPAERAMHRLLEVYFNLPVGNRRKEFLRKHPEIQEYFDRRAAEREEQAEQMSAFDAADPRLDPFRDAAQSALTAESYRRRYLQQLQRAAKSATADLSYRSERDVA